MTERNALLFIELIKPIEVIRSMDERFPAIVKVRVRFLVKPYSFKVHLQPRRLFIHVQFHIYIYIYLDISIHVLLMSKKDTGLFIKSRQKI